MKFSLSPETFQDKKLILNPDWWKIKAHCENEYCYLNKDVRFVVTEASELFNIQIKIKVSVEKKGSWNNFLWSFLPK